MTGIRIDNDRALIFLSQKVIFLTYRTGDFKWIDPIFAQRYHILKC